MAVNLPKASDLYSIPPVAMKPAPSSLRPSTDFAPKLSQPVPQKPAPAQAPDISKSAIDSWFSNAAKPAPRLHEQAAAIEFVKSYTNQVDADEPDNDFDKNNRRFGIV